MTQDWLSDEMRPAVEGPVDPCADDLVKFSASLAELALSFTEQQLDADGRCVTVAEQIVAGAVAIIPGVWAAAVETVNAQGHLIAQIMRGDQVARTVMHAQNVAGQGPCLDAWHSGEQVVALDVAADLRWPALSEPLAPTGVRSMLCTPMIINARRVGVLALLGDGIDFDDPTEDTAVLARAFAVHAGIALSGERRVAELTAALDTRDVIGQAKGILMDRFKLTPGAAFAMLTRASQDSNTKLRVICDRLCQTGSMKP